MPNAASISARPRYPSPLYLDFGQNTPDVTPGQGYGSNSGRDFVLRWDRPLVSDSQRRVIPVVPTRLGSGGRLEPIPSQYETSEMSWDDRPMASVNHPLCRQLPRHAFVCSESAQGRRVRPNSVESVCQCHVICCPVYRQWFHRCQRVVVRNIFMVNRYSVLPQDVWKRILGNES